MAATPVQAGRGRRDDLRRRAARGTVVNAAFLVGLNLLSFVKGFAVAGFLTVSDYGLWGLLAFSFAMLMTLLQIGIGDKYIQQDAEDQEVAFQQAFTLQCIVSALFVVIMAAALPLYAMAYKNSSIILPGLVLTLAIPGTALQSPLWAYYRRMDFLTQRRLQAFDPAVGFLVTVALAVAGAGYWALIVGVIAGAWSGGIAAVRSSPYPLRFRYAPGTMREYRSFSGPLFLSALAGVLVGFVPVLIAQRQLGLVAVGALAVANNISSYTTHVDDIVTNTLYPAICAVKDRRDLLLETFLKSNRLALLWALPAGIGIVLFGPDLVTHVLGHRWEVATYLIQAFGLAAAINQIGFNWSAFYRAIGNTRPMAIGSAITFVAIMAIGVPLLLAHGVNGYGTGMVLALCVAATVRVYFLARLFSLRPILINIGRAALPTLAALAAVLLLRLGLGGGERGPLHILVELVTYGAIVAAATLYSERALLAEFRGYLTGSRVRPQPTPA